MSNEAQAKQVTLGVIAPPHLHCGRTIPSVMKEICIALVPAIAMSVYHFGPQTLIIIGLSILAAVATESLCLKLMHKDQAVDDFHAVYIGMLLAFMLPADAPWWLPIIGSVVSIALGKMVFGGLGSNPFCPPAIGWSILMVCWPDIVDASSIQLYNEYLDPLYRLKYYGVSDITQFSYVDLLLGRQMGGLGATQVGALLLGGAIVAARLDVAIETPIGFILGIYILGGLMHQIAPEVYAPATFHLLSGNAVFGAFFLATEFGGSPTRPVARLLYGMIAGMLTILIRCFGIYADGVPFAVLLANLCMPYLDLIRPKPFGA